MRIDMSNPSRWLAVLRILVGVWFVKALWSKMDIVLLGGFFPFLGVEPRWLATMPQLVAKQAAENPILWYKAFLENTVLPNAEMFARLTAWGELLVGLSLTFGLLRRSRCLGWFVAQRQLRPCLGTSVSGVEGFSLHAGDHAS